MIKAAVFDLDHTLFDRYATLRKIVLTDNPDVLPFKSDIPREEAAEKWIYADKHFIHLGWDRVRRFFNDNNMLRASAQNADLFREYVVPCFMRTAVPYDFTLPMLNKLKCMGLKLGLITNGPSELQRAKLKMLGLEDIFDTVLISGEFGAAKPDTTIFKEMAHLMNLRPEEMLYIGDNPLNDVETSGKAGYIPVWVRTTESWVFPEIMMPELQVDTVEEIPEIIEKLIYGGH